MAKKYCQKKSMQALVNEVKTRKGSSSSIQGSNLATDINNLVIPAQRGSPTTVLTPSSTSKTIQRGKYIGGSVSVVLQDATAQLSQNGGYVPIDSGKTLASVKVPKVDAATIAYGDITMQNDQTSFSVSGLSFAPVGYAIILSSSQQKINDTYSSRLIGVVQTKDGLLMGRMMPPTSSSTPYSGVLVSAATATFSSNAISVSNIVATRDGSSYNCKFVNDRYIYVIWG